MNIFRNNRINIEQRNIQNRKSNGDSTQFPLCSHRIGININLLRFRNIISINTQVFWIYNAIYFQFSSSLSLLYQALRMEMFFCGIEEHLFYIKALNLELDP